MVEKVQTETETIEEMIQGNQWNMGGIKDPLVMRLTNTLRLYTLGMLDDQGCIFTGKNCTLKIEKQGRTILIGKKINGLYIVEKSIPSPSFAKLFFPCMSVKVQQPNDEVCPHCSDLARSLHLIWPRAAVVAVASFSTLLDLKRLKIEKDEWAFFCLLLPPMA
ncbi:unnamed protein product [Citrullus colocynthis]|uniref:Uncharacterized protein n=1 Tax=Citrullus colocynthis TaxID=252529 RepID=A0ABP0Y4J0_9ROSI